MSSINLADIPDLSGVEEQESTPFTDGWYAATIIEKRQFTDRNGNDRVFESSDTVSNAGDSRNIRLQLQIKRQSDGRELNTSHLVNYKPEHLTQETVQAVLAKKETAKDEGWGELFGPFMTLQRLAKLQKVAGVRQFAKNGNGGLDLHSLYGKPAYVRLTDDDRNPQYKAVADIRPDKPAKAPVL